MKIKFIKNLFYWIELKMFIKWKFTIFDKFK